MDETTAQDRLGDIAADAVLDCFGLLCPMPIVKTAAKIKEVQVGQVLEILSTDQGIKEDMPAWCKATGNEYLGIKESDGEFRVFIRRKT